MVDLTRASLSFDENNIILGSHIVNGQDNFEVTPSFTTLDNTTGLTMGHGCRRWPGHGW